MKGRSSKVLLFGALLSCLILIIAGKSSKMTVYASEAKFCARGSSPIYGILDPLLLR